MYLTKFVIPLPIPPLNIDLLSTYHVPGTALDTEFPEWKKAETMLLWHTT